jgi:hypothetical protein
MNDNLEEKRKELRKLSEQVKSNRIDLSGLPIVIVPVIAMLMCWLCCASDSTYLIAAYGGGFLGILCSS